MSRADELVRYRELMVGIDRSDEGELTSYHQAEKTIKDLEAQLDESERWVEFGKETADELRGTIKELNEELAAEKQSHEETRAKYRGVAG